MKLFDDFLIFVHNLCYPFYSWLDSLSFLEQLFVNDLICSVALLCVYSTIKRILPVFLNGGDSRG